jgi:hypothetical protein
MASFGNLSRFSGFKLLTFFDNDLILVGLTKLKAVPSF